MRKTKHHCEVAGCRNMAVAFSLCGFRICLPCGEDLGGYTLAKGYEFLADYERGVDRVTRIRIKGLPTTPNTQDVPDEWFGRLPAHAHRNLLDEWEICTDNDCDVYRTGYTELEKAAT